MSKPVIPMVCEYIEQHIKEPIDIQQLAALSGYSLSQFYAIFTESTGRSPAEYIRGRRLTLACWDLVFSAHRIIDIALEYQFDSQEVFTRAFTRRFGLSPGRFRRNTTVANYRRGRVGTVVASTYPERQTLKGVAKVGFYRSGDVCPEDIPFPSCMASVMRYLGEDYPWSAIESHGKTWRLNLGNVYFLGVTGMSFGFLWREGWHDDNVDHMFVADPREIIDRACKTAGYSYEVVKKEDQSGTQTSADVFREKVVASINRGVPVLAFGVIGPPECCIITGYEDYGNTVLGWNYFQDDPAYHAGLDSTEEGYFRKSNWVKDTWSLVVLGRKFTEFGTTLGVKAILAWAEKVMTTPKLYGRHSGFAALAAWEEQLLDDALFSSADESALRHWHSVHNSAVGMLAECRAWADQFMEYISEKAPAAKQQLVEAGNCFAAIHDLMWKMWDICGGFRNPDAWRAFAAAETRRQLAQVIRGAIEHDRRGLALIREASRLLG